MSRKNNKQRYELKDKPLTKIEGFFVDDMHFFSNFDNDKVRSHHRAAPKLKHFASENCMHSCVNVRIQPKTDGLRRTETDSTWLAYHHSRPIAVSCVSATQPPYV